MTLDRDFTYRGYHVTPLFLGDAWACCFFRESGGIAEWMTGAMDTVDAAITVAQIMIDDLYLPAKLRLSTH